MPIEIEAPDGSVVEFPDGTSRETMRSAMARKFPPSSRPKPAEEKGFFGRLGRDIAEQYRAGTETARPALKEIGEAIRDPIGKMKEAGEARAQRVKEAPIASMFDIPGVVKYPAQALLGGFQQVGAPVAGAVKTVVADPIRSIPTTGEVGGVAKETAAQTAQLLGEAFGGTGLLSAGVKGAAAAGRGIAGVVRPTASSIARGIAPPTSTSAVGEQIEKKVASNFEDLIKERAYKFANTKNEYINAGRRNQNVILNDYTRSLDYIRQNYADRLSSDELKFIDGALRRVTERPITFDVLEKERRFLNEVASGLKIEGAEAPVAIFAKDVSKLLENVIAKSVPKEFSAFQSEYKALSEPINRYNTALGQSVTARAGEYLPNVAKLDPAQIPNKFFKSRRSVEELRALSGDDGFVQRVAREHVANELRGVKNAKEIRDYMRRNQDWLQALPEIEADLDAVAKSRGRREFTKNLAKLGLVGTLGAGVVSKIGGLF